MERHRAYPADHGWTLDLFRSLSHSPHLGVLVLCGRRIDQANPALQRMSGYPIARLRALPPDGYLRLVHPDDRARVRAQYRIWAAGGPAGRPFTVRALHRSGRFRSVAVFGVSTRCRGRPAAVVLLTDVTDREETLSRLRRSEAAMERAQAIARVGSYVWHARSGRVEWTAEMFRLYGLAPERPIPSREQLDLQCDAADRPRLRRAIAQTMRRGVPLRLAFRLHGDDGALRYVRASGLRRPAEPPDRGYVLDGTLQDVTEQHELEQRVVEAAQREQQRIGADLHDSLGQELAALSMMAAALETRIRRGCPALSGAASKLAEVARITVAHARALAHGLTPIDLSQLGLAGELRRLAEEASVLYSADVRFRVCAARGRPDLERATHLYYIAKEAVANALHHGRPDRVRVELSLGAHRGRLIVRDDGHWRGTGGGAAGGAGLHIMQHRADLVGGRLTIARGTSAGTTVCCEFPIDA